MRSIPPPAINDRALYDSITAAKREPRCRRLALARPRVLAAYAAYRLLAPDLDTLEAAHLPQPRQEALRHAYTVETQPMTDLRGRLLERAESARCPFCGISESSTLDHYLPKELYPEFSVYSRNLVPSCGFCNNLKRELIVDNDTGVRVFVHPYFDFIPREDFLNVRVRISNNALILSYRLQRPANMPRRTFQRLGLHFDALGLADRYRRMGLEHLGGQYPSLRRAYGDNRDAARVANKLAEEAGDFEEAFGPNYWLAKLYRGLAGNAQFCDGGFDVVRARTQPL